MVSLEDALNTLIGEKKFLQEMIGLAKNVGMSKM
jgi:hypothetical protein